MTKKFRRVIFWSFVVFFAISSVIAVFLAQGWRLDFKTLKFLKTGGIFIKTSINGAKVYVNDYYAKTTSGILNYGALIGELPPKNYNVFVYKEGYYPWNKTVAVKSGLVTEFNNVIFIPLEFQKSKVTKIISKNISDFSVDEKNETVRIVNKANKTIFSIDFNGKYISSEKYKIATTSPEIVSQDGNKKVEIIGNKIWVYYLSDSTALNRKTGEKEVVAQYDSPIYFAEWFKDSEHVAWFANKELGITELNDQGGKRNTVKFYLNIDAPVFFSQDSSSLYFLEKSDNSYDLYKLSFN